MRREARIGLTFVLMIILVAVATVYRPDRSVVLAAYTLNIPATSFSFGTVAPYYSGNIDVSLANCTVRSTTRRVWCTLSVAPSPITTQFTDAAEGVTIPIDRLKAYDNYGGTYNALDNVSSKRLDRLYINNRNTNYPFSFALRLSLTGNESAGSYSMPVVVTAATL